jgi:ketosteroid isomerase-like protein
MSNDPAGFVGELVAAVNAHDLDRLVDCFAEGYVNETPAHPARGFVGVDQVHTNWSRIFGAVPDITASVEATAFDGDTVWSEWSLTGTRVDGDPYQMRGVMIFDVAGRQATAVRFYLEPVDDAPDDINAAVKMHVAER